MKNKSEVDPNVFDSQSNTLTATIMVHQMVWKHPYVFNQQLYMVQEVKPISLIFSAQKIPSINLVSYAFVKIISPFY